LARIGPKQSETPLIGCPALGGANPGSNSLGFARRFGVPGRRAQAVSRSVRRSGRGTGGRRPGPPLQHSPAAADWILWPSRHL